MKIAMICDVLGEANNGTVLAALNLIRYLKERGHTVYVVSPQDSTRGLEDYYVTPTRDFGFLINRIFEKNGVSLAKADPGVLEKVVEMADVVHLEVPFELSECALRFAREMGKPVTASFHCQAENVTAHLGPVMNDRIANHLVYKVFYQRIYQYCDVIHYPTEFIRRVFTENVPIERPYRVISNGVNDIFFQEKGEKVKHETFDIVSTGRYSREKDQATLIRAIGLSRYREKIRLILAGSGPMQEKLESLAKREGVNASFRFFAREELAETLHNADLYVHAAVVEIEAIGCMEAIASGLPAVIADSPRSATRFFAVDDRTLFRAGDPEDLCRKIEYFIENPSELVSCRDKYAKVREGFDQKSCMKQMEDMLADAAALRFRA
ncbi:MAG: glycosyltransferase [Clostridia bacterium]|nr:glycosyltransferase [Clostridia bacterium]